MRQLLLLFFVVTTFAAKSQIHPDYDYHYKKAIIFLNDGAKVYVEQIALIGSDVRFVHDRKKAPELYRKDTLTLIPVANIKRIKITRDAFVLGATVGVVPGYLLGYGIGYASYNENRYVTGEENDQRRKNKGLLYGVIGAIPTGVAGGILGTVFAKKNFRINGNRSKIEKLFRRRLSK